MPSISKQLARPIIFLDMDDVLCVDSRYSSVEVMGAFKFYGTKYPELWANLVLPDARNNLHELHREFFPQYVISSSWSSILEQWQMKEVFDKTGLDFVATNLHKDWTTPKGVGSSRVKEIESWISKHKVPKRPLLIIDDTESGWSLKYSRLDSVGIVILCEQSVGFIHEHLLKAQSILRGQLVR